eukprot:scaffold3619_cov328-Prasinococcus_capsulatus_cf.AAC.13
MAATRWREGGRHGGSFGVPGLRAASCRGAAAAGCHRLGVGAHWSCGALLPFPSRPCAQWLLPAMVQVHRVAWRGWASGHSHQPDLGYMGPPCYMTEPRAFSVARAFGAIAVQVRGMPPLLRVVARSQ